MAGTTTRLSIPFPSGTDAVNIYPPVASSAATILDNATVYTEGTLAALPAVGTVEHGHLYRTTDKNTLQWSNGSVWAPVGLTWVTTAISTSVVNGQWLYAVGGTTITLPTPALNSVVAISAQGSATGASPVTVSGTNIWGLGLAGASSFTLGISQAFAILQSDGTNWFILSGQQDTGWVALSLGGGVSAGGGYTPTARLVGSTVYLSGGPLTGSAITAWATIPAGLRPTSTVTLFPVVQGVSVTATAGGALASSAGLSQLNLDGINYRAS